MNKFVPFHSDKDLRTEDEGHRLRVRTTLLMVLFCCVLGVFFALLYTIQVVNGADYLARANYNVTQAETVDSVRGEIWDRNGNVLVSNQVSYQVELDPDRMGEERNEILSRLLELCRQEGVEWTDTLPVSATQPWAYTKEENLFAYTSQGEDGETRILPTQLGRLAQAMGWVEDPATADLTAQELLEAMAVSFGVEDERLNTQTRQLLGVLYELTLRSKEITYNEYVFASQVDIALITRVKEEGLAGVSFVYQAQRQYNTPYAAHVLGRVGPISADTWPTYREQGYPMDADVGQDGMELAYENYLHGSSGVRLIETDETGKIINQQWQTLPDPGDHVVLTLDETVQKVAEEGLAEFVQGLKNPSGAAAVMVDMTGGVLAMASYPTYNLATYSQDYNDLLADENKPLLNRATQGIYAPGSTFKMVTAVAGLTEGLITPTDTFYCGGVYTHYSDYRPVCWIYTNTGGNHASETVSQAITDSCNIFFYDLGRRVGITRLGEYAAQFGLGEYTGIELPESKGTVAGPETTRKLGGTWYEGQTLSAAIGQDNNQFTPIQLANYVATLVNGGDHYQAHLLDQVVSSQDGSTVYDYQPQLTNSISIDPEDLAAVKLGMYNLSKTASMARYFADLPVEVGCKTGTAEVSGSSTANATFVCFAPYDNPQVALCLVAEKGASGGNLAALAADMLRAYFDPQSLEDEETEVVQEQADTPA